MCVLQLQPQCVNSGFPQTRLLESVQQNGNREKTSVLRVRSAVYLWKTMCFLLDLWRAFLLDSWPACSSQAFRWSFRQWFIFSYVMQSHCILSPYVACCLKEMLPAFYKWVDVNGVRIDSNTKPSETFYCSVHVCKQLHSCKVGMEGCQMLVAVFHVPIVSVITAVKSQWSYQTHTHIYISISP